MTSPAVGGAVGKGAILSVTVLVECKSYGFGFPNSQSLATSYCLLVGQGSKGAHGSQVRHRYE